MIGMRGPRWPLVAALLTVAGFAAFGSPAPAPAAEAARGSMVDNEPDLTHWPFAPAEVTVPAGSTVVWVNTGKEEHTVTSDPDSRERFDSGYKKRGAIFQRVFSKPGRFSYYCAPHPWMKGTVVVVDGPTPAPATAAARSAASVSSVTTAPAPTTTTFPPSLAAPSTAPAAASDEAAPAAPEETSSTSATTPGDGDSEEAALASSEDSGNNLAGTLAIVLLPTLGGLALGARLRRSASA